MHHMFPKSIPWTGSQNNKFLQYNIFSQSITVHHIGRFGFKLHFICNGFKWKFSQHQYECFYKVLYVKYIFQRLNIKVSVMKLLATCRWLNLKTQMNKTIWIFGGPIFALLWIRLPKFISQVRKKSDSFILPLDKKAISCFLEKLLNFLQTMYFFRLHFLYFLLFFCINIFN